MKVTGGCGGVEVELRWSKSSTCYFQLVPGRLAGLP